MTDGRTDLACCSPIHRLGGYRVVLARGLSPYELAERLATTLLHDTAHIVVAVGDYAGTSLLDLMEDT
ncbi:hypothetical protein [Streptomyces sp. NPDC056524]|uniref:hypothetical protein n=1 Tax=Streptomyces sp. NPDC056524 TaxID=3345851 RepID=UPI00367B09B9